MLNKSSFTIALQYTCPISVGKIMDAFGTFGFSNSPQGLYCFRPEYNIDFKAEKGDWIVGYIEDRKPILMKKETFKKLNINENYKKYCSTLHGNCSNCKRSIDSKILEG